MKRCPTCTRTFLDEQLSYCTDDGTPLVEQSGSSSFDPQATLLSQTPPQTSESGTPPPTQAYRADEMPGWQTPGSWSEPASQPPPAPPAAAWNSPPQQRPQGSSWSPPPPPNAGFTANKSQQNPLAVASLALGIFSMTIGLCCYLGFATGPVAIILGAIALSQLKNNPMQSSSSKGMAIAGMVTGAVAPLLLLLLLILNISLRSLS